MSEQDIFDPKNFRKPQDPRLAGDENDGLMVPSVIETRKPRAPEFVRVHKDSDYRSVIPLLAVESATKRREELYFLHPEFEVPPELLPFVHDYMVAFAITRERMPFLYTVRVSDTTWYDSALICMKIAQNQWVHIISQQDKQAYITQPSVDDLPEPSWPVVTFRDLIARAFATRVVKDINHPVVRKLRGAHESGNS
jgi:hypothetical protein